MSDDFYTKIILLFIGGALTTIGGFIATIIKLRLDKKQEICDMKICLIDELSEIKLIISRMVETHKTTQLIPNDYFNSLKSTNQSFNDYKLRLFLIIDDRLRSSIRNFYKTLAEKIEKSINTVGTLDSSVQNDNKINNLVKEFEVIEGQATTLETQIKKYRFKAYYIF